MKKHAISLLCALFVCMIAFPESVLKPRVAVFGFLNMTGDSAYDMPAESASQNLARAIDKTGLYEASLEAAMPRTFSDGVLAEWCEKNARDYVLFGSIVDAVDGAIEYRLSLFSYGLRTTVRRTETGASVLDVFPITDKLCSATVSSMPGVTAHAFSGAPDSVADYVQWGGLYVRTYTLKPQWRKDLGRLPDIPYLVVFGIVPESSAYARGLRPGDVFLSLNGKTVSTVQDCLRILNEAGANSVTASINRLGTTIEIQVSAQDFADGLGGRLWPGFVPDDWIMEQKQKGWNTSLYGLAVYQVSEGGYGALSGLVREAVVFEVNGKTTKTVVSFYEALALRPPKETEYTFIRNYKISMKPEKCVFSPKP